MKFRPPAAPDPLRSNCSSAKIAYASEHEAEDARADVERKRGVHLAVYQCPECLAWHLTSLV